MLEVKFDGIVEFATGSGQSRYESFEYTIQTARESENGLYTHVVNRFAPMLIKQDKKFKGLPYKKIKSLVITEVKKLDLENYLIGKDILSLNEKEVQDFACFYDLYEVPLAGTQALSLIREKALIAYLHKVKKIPMKKPEDKLKWEWFVRQEDGTFRFDSKGEKFPIQYVEEYFKTIKKEIKKKGMEDLLGTATAEPKMAEVTTSAQSDDMPSEASLLDGVGGISFSTP